MLVWSRHNICNWYTRYKYYQCFSFSFFFSLFFFSILWFVNFVKKKLIYWAFFFLEFTLLKRIFPKKFKKQFSHSAKIHQEKSLFLNTISFVFPLQIYLLCPAPPPQCNFSFSPPGCSQSQPLTGQGEPAPTLVHLPWFKCRPG
jgi:hypothetical protein